MVRKQKLVPAVSDARFAAVHQDPRFSRFPRKHTSVIIDERFKGVLEDPDFQVKSTLNKHGKKVVKKTKNDDMRRFYHLEEPAGHEAAANDGVPLPREKGNGALSRTKASTAPTKASRVKAAAGASGDAKRVAPASAQHGDAEDSDDDAPAEVAIAKSAQAPRQRKSHMAAAPVPASLRPSKTNFESDSDEAGAELDGESDDGEDDDEADDGGLLDDDDAAAAKAGASDHGDGAAASAGDVSDEDDEDAEATLRFQRMRGMLDNVSISDGDDDDDDDDGTGDALDEAEITIGGEEDVELDPEEWGVGAAAGNPDADGTLIMLEDATPRLAVVDLDWQRMRAVDIFAVLRSFLGKGASLRRVVVYVSDYGREQMAREKVDGPQGLRAAKNSEDSDDEDVQISDAHALERVRMYERSKLRWHFAIAEFDSAASANFVYEECDGIEFEESSTRFDLRFVPDSEDFSQREVRDEASEIPAGYEAPMFKSKALQHTNPTLTWDEDDDSRKKALHRKLGADEVKEEEFAAYLASESEDDGDDDVRDADAIRQRYAAIVSGAAAEATTGRKRNGAKTWLGNDEHADGADAGPKAEMEVTFASGLENLGKRILEKKAVHKARAGQTIFEQYLQRKKDKKAAQRAIGKVNVDSGSDDDGRDAEEASDADADADRPSGTGFFNDEDAQAGAHKGADTGFDDDFFNGAVEFDDAADSDDADADDAEPNPQAKGKKARQKDGASKEAREAERQRRAELELLMLDDCKLAAVKDGVSVRGLVEKGGGDEGKKKLSHKQLMAAKKEQRKRAKDRRDSDDDEDFDADIADPRFKAITSAEFAIDPTDPHFQRIKNPKKLITEIADRRKKARPDPQAGHPTVLEAAASQRSQGKSQLAALVGNLKRKRNGGGTFGNTKNWS